MNEFGSVEAETRSQFARIFCAEDFETFKSVADFYFLSAATLRKSDITGVTSKKLLIRNSQKRLFIGVATELLLKAGFLKNGYYINTPKKPKKMPGNAPYRLTEHSPKLFSNSRTNSLHFFIESLSAVSQLGDGELKRGLRVAKVFRNKEAHIVAKSHEYVPNSYRTIENSIVAVYKDIFGENLRLRFSMERNDPGYFTISAARPARLG